MRLIILTILLILLFALWRISEARTSVQWVVDHISNSNNGAASSKATKPYNLDGDTLKIISEYLPELKLQVLHANFERSFWLLDSEPDVCSGNKIVNDERRKKYLFSQLPQTIFPGQLLVVSRGSPLFEKLTKHQGDISIRDVLVNNPDITLGLVAGRSYEDNLDTLFKLFSKNIWLRKGEGASKGLVEMFKAGRFDAMLEYASVFEHYAQEAKLPEQSYRRFAITEIPPYTLGYIVCADSDTGHHLMQQFNHAINQSVKKRAYLDAHLKWFDQSIHTNIIQHYNRIYHTQFE